MIQLATTYAREAFHRVFTRRSLAGWLVLLAVTVWKGVDAWSNVEFLAGKLQGVRTTVIGGLSVLSSSAWQWVLLIAGLTWVFVAAATTRPRPGRQRQRVEAERLLRRALQHGEAVCQSNHWGLSLNWMIETQVLITGAFGLTEAYAFSSREDLRAKQSGTEPRQWMRAHLDRLQDLLRRFEFMTVHKDFKPESWPQ